MAKKYLIVQPKQPIAGCLAVVVESTKCELLSKIELKGEKQRFIARAHLSDHIPLHGSVEDILSRKQYHNITINENPQSIYLHHGGRNAIFYDLCSDSKGRLDYIEVEVEAELPSAVFIPVRTAVNELIDSIQRGRALPLIVVRIDLLIKGSNVVFAHQLILPYPASLQIGPMGGIHQHPAFSSYESVLREAITSSSPYYRLLCAYRLYEGLNELKRWLKLTSEELGVEERLPKDPKIDKETLDGIGIDVRQFEEVDNMKDLWKKFTDLRNQVAHYFTKGSGHPLHLSNGYTYMEYSLASAVLLHYSNLTFENLQLHFNKHLRGKLALGSVLPMPQYRDKFIIKI